MALIMKICLTYESRASNRIYLSVRRDFSLIKRLHYIMVVKAFLPFWCGVELVKWNWFFYLTKEMSVVVQLWPPPYQNKELSTIITSHLYFQHLCPQDKAHCPFHDPFSIYYYRKSVIKPVLNLVCTFPDNKPILMRFFIKLFLS